MYCAITDIELKVPEAKLIELTVDSGSEYDEDVITGCIVAGDALADSYYAAKYSTPLATPVPDRVKDVSTTLAIYGLYSRRAGEVGMNEHVRQEYEDAVAWLKDVAKGLVTLGIDPPPTGTKAQTLAIDSEERVFSRTNLNGY